MSISWKSFFLSFGVAFLLFSLLMGFLCVNLFKNYVPTPIDRELAEHSQGMLAHEQEQMEGYIFYCTDKDNAALDFSALVRVDASQNRLLVTPLYGGNLLAREGSLFYISTLFDTYGASELSDIFASLTGCYVAAQGVLNLRDDLPSHVKESTVRYLDFLELLPTLLGESTNGFSLEECPLSFEENEGLRIVLVEPSLKNFKALEIK